MRKENNVSGIYCIENIITHKKYIGQSKHMHDRWSKHIGELNRNIHDNDYLQKAWNKYGQDGFKFYVVEYCNIEQLNEREIYYIESYNTLNRDYGYNLRSGGQDNVYYSEETKQKMRESVLNSYLDEDRREIQRTNALKQWSNPEIKAKICGEKNGMYGKTHTDETRKKISDKNKGKISWKRNTTPVFCIELNEQFNDATEASKKLGVDSSAIIKVCKKERHTCGGYHWEFVNYSNNIKNEKII